MRSKTQGDNIGTLFTTQMGNIRLITNKLGLSHLAKSSDELKTIIQKIIKGELKAKIIPPMKYYNDGNCGSRVIKKIKQILHEI